MNRFWLLAGVAGLASSAQAQMEIAADPAFPCNATCESFNEPQAPFHVHGSTWYVGTKQLSSLLIVSDAGHILVDTGYPAAAPVIAGNIAALGFDAADIRLIVNSHPHGDHGGALGTIQQATGATVAASPKSAEIMETGGPLEEDLFYRPRTAPDFPLATDVQRVADRETLTVGPNAVTAVFTPGHSPGGTSWTWESCEDGTCLDVVYVESLNPIAPAGWRFSDNPDHVATYRASAARIAALPCDIALAPHPETLDLLEKAARIGEDGNPFVDPAACAAYAASYAEQLDELLATEANE